MKTRILITIGITIIAVLISAFAIYDSSTVVFVECVPPYEQVDGKCVIPTFKFLQDPNSNLFTSDCPGLINLEYTTKRRIFSCGANPPQAQYSILNLDGIKTCFMESDQYYYLKAGEGGSITYQYEVTENKKNPNEVFNLDQKPHFMCKQSGFVACTPSGISVDYEFDDKYIPVGKQSIITAHVKVEKDIPSQSYVLHLSPNICANPEILFGVLGD